MLKLFQPAGNLKLAMVRMFTPRKWATTTSFTAPRAEPVYSTLLGSVFISYGFCLVFPADGFGAGPCSSLAKENQDGGSSRPQASMPGLAASGMSP